MDPRASLKTFKR